MAPGTRAFEREQQSPQSGSRWEAHRHSKAHKRPKSGSCYATVYGTNSEVIPAVSCEQLLQRSLVLLFTV